MHKCTHISVGSLISCRLKHIHAEGDSACTQKFGGVALRATGGGFLLGFLILLIEEFKNWLRRKHRTVLLGFKRKKMQQAASAAAWRGIGKDRAMLFWIRHKGLINSRVHKGWWLQREKSRVPEKTFIGSSQHMKEREKIKEEVPHLTGIRMSGWP